MEILKQTISTFQPDTMLTMIGDRFSLEKLHYIQKQGIKTLVWLTEDPYYIDCTKTYAPWYDYIFTIEKQAVSVYEELGHHRVYYLPLGTNDGVFHSRNMAPKYDISLIGFPYRNRIALIERILKDTPFTVAVVGRWKGMIKNTPRLYLFNGWFPPYKTAHFYNGSKVNLNTLRDAKEEMNENSLNIPNGSINNRTFDIAACEAFQIVQHSEGITPFFEPDRDIVTFHDEEDLLKKLFYYMDLDQERNAIARRAADKTKHYHTFLHRLAYMIETVQSDLH
ncbi:glycosyltransferase [Bacillus songklensis]|uniref:Glycosyltransferase n=1 Tax=Bacillus songklensis TaxID=1069116 RepID=A0ABV8B535_9BACI